MNAVNKMNLEKYDLVLMDIVMPNLDGVSATSLIRQFDPRTPIISMTSNSQPNELLTYMNHGMNDVLPKPFTKQGLLNMLEVSQEPGGFLVYIPCCAISGSHLTPQKHLIHLKTVQQLDEIPNSLGLPTADRAALQKALAETAAALTSNDPMQGNAEGSGSGSSDPTKASTQPRFSIPRLSFGATGGDDEANPLAGMGFSDEE